jgi:hypothetical protein
MKGKLGSKFTSMVNNLNRAFKQIIIDADLLPEL